MKSNSKTKNKPKEKLNFGNKSFAVVKFVEPGDDTKSFESIPDNWFLDEGEDEVNRLCYWPPKSKKSSTLRAMNRDEPDDDWDVYRCEVVSEGHATYSFAAIIAREKASQKYNTSSADEHILKTKFRRLHPGLINKGEKSFENVFAAAKAAQASEKNQLKIDEQKEQETSTDTVISPQVSVNNDTEVIQRGSDKGKHSSENKDHNPRNNNSENHSQSLINRSRSRSHQSKSRSDRRSIRDSRSKSRNRSRSNHSGSHTSRSLSRSNRSLSRPSSSRAKSHNNSSRSSSNHSGSHTSRSRSNRSLSRSRSSRAKSHNNSSRSGSNRSESRSYYSHSSRNDSESGRKKHRSCSTTTTNTVRGKTYQDNSSRNQRTSNHLNTGRDDRSRHGSHTRSSHSRSVSSTSREEQRHLAIHRTPKIDNGKRRSRDTSSYRQTETRDERPSKSCQRNDSVLSPRARNKIRVEAMYQQHRQQQAANRSRISSANSVEMRQSTDDKTLLKKLLQEVKEIKTMVNKNERRFVESDRRLTRLEVTVNKSFIVLGDLSNAMNARMVMGNTLPRETKPPRGFHVPKLPIKRLRHLICLNKDLQNDEFFNFLINKEREYCTSSSSTDTVTMTTYLKRFISVDLRASLVLKDLKGEQGLRLYHDFHKVYEFLREVMKSGYQIKGKILTNNDVHIVLRTVWGRSKQTLAGEANKKRS